MYLLEVCPVFPNLACRTLLCSSLAIAAVASAQDTGTVSGAVVDSVSGQLIARVLVESPTNGPAQLTDSSGHFFFTNVPLGAATLRYRRPGYFAPGGRQEMAFRPVTVAPGVNSVSLPLEPAASVHGSVQIADNDSPAGVRVELYGARITDGRRSWQLQATQAVNGDGSFEFDDLPPGTYAVHTQASLDPTPSTAKPRIRTGYAPVFAPDTNDLHTATLYALGGGQVAEARVRVSRVPFYPVSIRVSGAQGARMFQVTGGGFTNWPVRLQGEDGTVETELPNGSYTLRSVNGGRQSASGELNFQVSGAPVSGPVITVAAATGMPVETDVIAPEEGSGGTADAAPPRIATVTLASASDPESPILSDRVEYDDAGTGTLRRSVPPGVYWVSAMVNGNGYVAALTSGGTDLFRNPLSIVGGSAPALHATVREDGGSIAVTRSGEVQSEPCAVELIPLSPGGTDQVSSSETSGNTAAAIDFSNLAPGDYLILATRNRVGIAFREPGVLERLGGTRVSVTAGASAQATVSTFVTPPVGITGSR